MSVEQKRDHFRRVKQYTFFCAVFSILLCVGCFVSTFFLSSMFDPTILIVFLLGISAVLCFFLIWGYYDLQWHKLFIAVWKDSGSVKIRAEVEKSREIVARQKSIFIGFLDYVLPKIDKSLRE